MGLLSSIFGSKQQPINEMSEYWSTVTAYRPVFYSWGGKIYEDGLCRAAIHTRATHISKLKITVQGAAKPVLQTNLRHGPNSWQTWSDFLYRTSTILDNKNTAFIVPILDAYGEAKGIYTVLPTKCEIKAYEGIPYLRYEFATGEHAAVELSKCTLLTKFQYESDFFGEDNEALRQTMDLITIQKQGIAEGVKNSATYRFMATLANFSKKEDLEKEKKKYNEHNFAADANGGGVLLWPNTYKDIKQIESKPFVADAAQMKIIQGNVYDYFGVNEKIIRNQAFGDEWSAFYEGVVEPFAIQLSEALTKMLFSPLERSYGAAIMATSNRLQYMSNKDKLDVSAQMADRGLMTRNEIREIWNLPPLAPEIGDKLPVRGEYYNLGEGTENDKKDEADKDAD